MSLRKALNEVKKDNKKNGKMLNQLHDLDDKIENFIQKLEAKIDSVKDNPVFQKKAHNLLADMSREYAEFIIALRAVVNAVDRKSQVVPKWERQPSKIRDVHKDDSNDMEEPPPAETEPKESTKLREAFGERVPPKQQKAVDNMKKKGFHIVIWEPDFVAMMDKKGNPAEVYGDGTIKYPKKRLREALGSNRDYKARDKAFMKAAKEKGLINLWDCPECGRKNLKKFSECPRCKAKMPTK